MQKTFLHIYIIGALVLLSSMGSIFAQSNKVLAINTVLKSINQNGDRVDVLFDIVLDDLFVNPNDLIIITPIIKSNEAEDLIELNPVAVMGKTRLKVVSRNHHFHNSSPLPANLYSSMVRHNKSLQRINFSASLDYASWMHDAQMMLKFSITKCATCLAEEVNYPVFKYLLPVVAPPPTYKISFIVPDVIIPETVEQSHGKSPFSDNTIAQLYEHIVNEPCSLSLDEILFLAQNYDVASTEFKKIFEVASHIYPESKIAVANAIAFYIEEGRHEHAIKAIEKSKFRADMLNNLGVAYARIGDTDAARKIFEEAVSAGDRDAEWNLRAMID